MRVKLRCSTSGSTEGRASMEPRSSRMRSLGRQNGRGSALSCSPISIGAPGSLMLRTGYSPPLGVEPLDALLRRIAISRVAVPDGTSTD
jgi:hypothetical protein